MFNRQRNKILLLVFIAGMINYLDRTAFSIAIPYIKSHFGLNPAEIGIILSSFFLGYALFNFIGGYLSDIYGPRKVFAIAMVAWSLFCGLTGLAFSYTSLFIIRVLFGVSEGPIGTTLNKTISNWIPLDQRARAVGIGNAANPLGGAIAGPVFGSIVLFWNWRVAFIIMMCLGFVWVVFWLKTFTDKPHDNPHISPEEIAEYNNAQQNSLAVSLNAEKIPFSFYITQPIVLFTALAFFAINYILYFFLTWFPGYLSMERGLNIQEMSIATSIPWLIGSIGMALGGIFSDWLYRRNHNLLFSRKLILTGGLILSAICIAASGYVSSVTSAITLMSLGIFFMYLSAFAPWSIVSDNIPQEKVGGVGGFIHLLANTAGIIAPALTGYIVQYTGSFIYAFVLSGAIGLAGALGVAIFVKPIKRNTGKNVGITTSNL